MSLQEFLANNNSAETQWGVWVNPQDLEDYRIGQYVFENDGVLDEKVCIGNLDKLSHERRVYCGEEDGLSGYVRDLDGLTRYKNKLVKFNPEALADAISNGFCNEEFEEHFRTEAEEQWQEFSQEWARQKIEELKEYFAPGGEWEEECEQQRLEAEAWAS